VRRQIHNFLGGVSNSLETKNTSAAASVKQITYFLQQFNKMRYSKLAPGHQKSLLYGMIVEILQGEDKELLLQIFIQHQSWYLTTRERTVPLQQTQETFKKPLLAHQGNRMH
jgi:hypothetical protein